MYVSRISSSDLLSAHARKNVINNSMLCSFEMCLRKWDVVYGMIDQFVDLLGCLLNVSNTVGNKKYVCVRRCHGLTILFLE